ncbi:MAG: tRNA pseudouridine(38-40) synthase TruA [Fidelibacterota bacterium]
MPNYKIILEYDGTDFSGWQRQRGQRTVQGELEKALGTLSGGRMVRIHGAGRTDAGVHARGQVANFLLEENWDPVELRNAINGNVGEDILVHRCRAVSDDFHARYSAKRRRYGYYCRVGKSVIDRMYVWNVPHDISMNRLRLCARRIVGDKDFTSFCKFSPGLHSRRCTVYQSKWIKRGDFVSFVIEANRFLQHMVRYLVGTMMEAAKGKFTDREFSAMLEAEDREAKVFKAPARALFLEDVIY